MLKRKLCEASFEWELSCEGPLLIRDGRCEDKGQCEIKGTKEDGYPDCLFISHTTNSELKDIARNCNQSPPNLTYYIPGTSIRGPFRAQAERIIRSLLPGEAESPLTACDPFEQEEDNAQYLSCSKQLEKPYPQQTAYAAACPACKLFGCTGLASRISFTDANIDIESGYSSVYRDMVGIDRFTGGSYSGALMRFHVLENTRFTTTITLINFELWQLGLLAYLFKDFEEELVPIGFGKTKGFGRVKGEVKKITLTYPASPEKPARVEHLGSLVDSAEECERYGILSYDAPTFTKFEPEPNGLSLYQNVSVNDSSINSFWKTVAPSFNSFIDELNRQAKKEEES